MFRTLKDTRFLLMIAIGLGLRVLTMALPGTEDMYTNQLWGARALEQGITRVYMYEDTYYFDKAALLWKRIPFRYAPPAYQTEIGMLDHVPNYPPLSLFFFWLSTGACKFLQGGKLALGGY